MMWKNDWQTVLNAAVHHGTTNPWRRVRSMEYECSPGWVWAVENMRTLCAWWSGDLPLLQHRFLLHFFWHFVFCFVVFFGLHLQHNCCMQGVWKRQQDTENTRTGRQTRPFNGSPSARIACVCVRMCVNAAQWQSVNLLGATIYGISCCGASR